MNENNFTTNFVNCFFYKNPKKVVTISTVVEVDWAISSILRNNIFCKM